MSGPDRPDDAEKAAEIFRILGHETRLRLLLLMRGGERPVSDLEALSGIVQPGLSQQLAILRKAGLVTTRREAKQVFYSLAPAALRDAAALIGRLQEAGAEAGPADAGGKGRKVRSGSAATFARIL